MLPGDSRPSARRNDSVDRRRASSSQREPLLGSQSSSAQSSSAQSSSAQSSSAQASFHTPASSSEPVSGRTTSERLLSSGKIVAVKGPAAGLIVPRPARAVHTSRKANRLDKWCGRQSRMTRLAVAVSSVLVASIVLSFLTAVAVYLLAQRFDRRVESVRVVGGGSDTMYAATACVAQDYNDQVRCGRVVVPPDTDSLEGWQLMMNNSYTFALTQMIPVNDSALVNNRLYYPFEASMLALAVNLPVAGAAAWPMINLSREALVAIYDGSVRYWDDHRIRQTNDPAFPWPQRLPVVPLHRTDPGAGSSYVFQTLLCYLSVDHRPALAPQWPYCPTFEKGWNNWPVANPANWSDVTSSAAMLRAVQSVPGAVGYLASTLVTLPAKAGVQLASVANQAGAYVLPTIGALHTAVDLAPMSSVARSYSIDLLDLPDCPDCWPISSFGYVGFKRPNVDKQQHQQQIGASACFAVFLHWFYNNCRNSPLQSLCLPDDDFDVCQCQQDDFGQCQCQSQSLCPSDANVKTILQSLAVVQPEPHEPWPFLHTALLGAAVFVCLLLVFAALVLVCFVAKAKLWRRIRRDREQEKLCISRASDLSINGSSSSSSSEARQAKLLQDVEIADTGDCVQLISVIGAGAWSRVYLAEWVGSPVAVKKFYQIPDHQQMQQDFFEETTVMSKLRHPNVVQLLAACSSPEFMLIMEYCRLGSLHGILKTYRERPSDVLFLTDVRRYLMATDVCRGLLYLHTRKPPIIHRDLKPHNILVTDTLVCKLADFGMARSNFADAVSNNHFAPRGTLAYLAREVLTQQAWSVKSDIYSLTLTLWELFATQEIFAGLPTNAIVRGVLNKQLRPDLSLVDPALRQFFAQCWAELPESRPPIEIVFDFFVRLLPSKSTAELELHQRIARKLSFAV